MEKDLKNNKKIKIKCSLYIKIRFKEYKKQIKKNLQNTKNIEWEISLEKDYIKFRKFKISNALNLSVFKPITDLHAQAMIIIKPKIIKDFF